MQTVYYIAILVTVALADGTQSTGYMSNEHQFHSMGECLRVISNRDNLPQIYGSLAEHVGDQLIKAGEIGCFTEESLRSSNDELQFRYQPYQAI